MNIRQVRYAIAVAEERSFTGAAELMQVSQSGVSAQVATLERELGITLFERSSRGVGITPAGNVVIEQLRRALAEVEAIETVVDELKQLTRGSVAIGAPAGTLWPVILDGLQNINESYPQIELTLREGAAPALLEGVLSGQLDLAVTTWVDGQHDELEYWAAVEERLMAFVSPEHPWAGREVIEPKELLEQQVVCLSQGSASRTLYTRMMRAEGLVAPVAWNVSLPSTARALAARNLGVALIASSPADPPHTLSAIKIAAPPITSALGIVCRTRPELSPAAKASMAILKEHLSLSKEPKLSIA